MIQIHSQKRNSIVVIQSLMISRWEAVGQHDPPYSHEEELKVVEIKKKDPPSADEVVGIVTVRSLGKIHLY